MVFKLLTSVKKEIFLGFIIAFLSTLCGVYIFIEFLSKDSFSETLAIISKNNLYAKILVGGALLNLLVFFIFLKKKQVYRARGVLLQTFLIAFLILLLTLINK